MVKGSIENNSIVTNVIKEQQEAKEMKVHTHALKDI